MARRTGTGRRSPRRIRRGQGVDAPVLCAGDGGRAVDLDPVRAAELEVEWWRLHREHQHDPEVSEEELVAALTHLYAHVYGTSTQPMREAARLRVEAMDLSDRWVAAGYRADDPLLAAERRALAASYAALHDAVDRA